MSGRKDFLSQPAPENYVAGLGRGATGFTTRSYNNAKPPLFGDALTLHDRDLGPAREGPSDQQLQEIIAKRAAALGTAAPTAYGGTKRKAEEVEEEQYQDAENEEGLLGTGNYDRDDDEADRIYQGVDDRMARRRKKAREARELKEREEYERKNPKIQQQFADLKRALGAITDEEWANLPEAGDHTGKNRRSKQNMKQRFYAVPDSVLVGARDSTQLGTEVQDENVTTEANGGSNEQTQGTMTNFATLGAARDKVLQVRLDQAAQSRAAGDTLGTSTSVDPKGYLTSLDQKMQAGLENVGDIKRARLLLESVIKTNPKHAPGWIAAARLEEHAGKIVAARNVIRRGCENCPRSEDAWLENIRLHTEGSNQNAKIIAAEAIRNINQSVRLWIEAMKLESMQVSKKRVLRKALDHVPQSVVVWKEAVSLEEDPADAKLLLAKATEIIPLSVELWLALARLESPDQAQIVLNKARKAVPTSSEVWIAATRLQEQVGRGDLVPVVMERAVKALIRESAMLKHDDWIAQAEICEAEGAILTCRAIIKATLGWGLEADDERKITWLEDARRSTERGQIETARAIYALAMQVFYNRKSVWLAAANLERQHGTKEKLYDVLEDAVKSVPKATEVWMTYGREMLQARDMEGARRVFGLAFRANPESEEIYLAAVKLEADNGDSDRARQLFAQARSTAKTDRIWIRSAAFERQLGDNDHALLLVNEALLLFPKAARLWMMKGQIYEDKGMVPQAREAFNTGTRACPNSAPLWLLLSRLEERNGPVVKARSVLDRARLANPKSPEIWTESVRLELRANNIPAAKQNISKALQECPHSGMIWNERIWHLEPRTQRKPRILEAIKSVQDDPLLFVTAAKIFWLERKLEKADNWFAKASNLDSDEGDCWAWWYKFLLQHGTEEKTEEVKKMIVQYEPKHGEVWARVRKDPRNGAKATEEILDLVVKELVLEGEK